MGDQYDPHASCKAEIEYWRKEHAEKDRIKQVVLHQGHGVLKVLNIVRVDAFGDGLRILVE